MTNTELKQHFEKMMFLRDAKYKGKDFDKLLDSAIRYGKEDFWGAYPWAFKEKRDTVTTTAGTETVELPDDFDGLLSVIEDTTTYGRKLVRLSADEYDRLVPDSDSRNNATPAYYKVYYDIDNAVWKLALYPTPNATITLYINYHVIEDNNEIPEKYVSGVLAGVAKHLNLPGSPEYLAASQAFVFEVERLKKVDRPVVETPTQFLTEYESSQAGDKKWYENWD